LNVSQFSIADTDYLLRPDHDIDTRAYLLFQQRVFQTGPVFRKMGVSQRYDQEFLVGNFFAWMEDYIDAARRCLDLFKTLKDAGFPIPEEINVLNFSQAVNGRQGDKIKYSNLEESINSSCNNLPAEDLSEHRDVFRKKVKKSFKELTIIIGAPGIINPTAKKIENVPYVEDFQIVWKGRTIFHGCTEENDPIKLGHLSGNAFKKYRSLLEYGIPPYSSVGLSIYSLVQCITGEKKVTDLFPSLLK
jgi:lysyl-tRNA synthetase class II